MTDYILLKYSIPVFLNKDIIASFASPDQTVLWFFHMALDKSLFDEEDSLLRIEENRRRVLYNRKQNLPVYAINRGYEAKTDIPVTETNPNGAGKPTLLGRRELWEFLHAFVLDNGWNATQFAKQISQELNIKVNPNMVYRWKKDNRRGFKDKLDIFLREHQLKRMFDTAMKNEIEVLDITIDEGIRKPKLLAIRQKATEHVLDTLGREFFSKEPDKSPQDKQEQMLRMRTMLQKLTKEDTPALYEKNPFDTFATPTEGVGEFDVQDAWGRRLDNDPQPVHRLWTYF